MPAADIAVLHQEHALFVIEHDRANPKRHAAGKPPIDVKQPSQRRLEISSHALQIHHRGQDLCASGARRLILASAPLACQYIDGFPGGMSAMAAFTLAHLSDPHLPPLPTPRLAELVGKRMLGYINWTRNRHRFHRRDVVDLLVSDLRAQTPDHIAITGDLVNLSLDAEFAAARVWLESIG